MLGLCELRLGMLFSFSMMVQKGRSLDKQSVMKECECGIVCSNEGPQYCLLRRVRKPMSGIICSHYLLTLKAPITTAIDDIHKYFFIVFQRN